MNDVDQSLRDIRASPEQLREEIVRLSEHGHRRSRAQGWATKVRFLTIAPIHTFQIDWPYLQISVIMNAE